ncbi:MAG: exo-alpha-sialidase, partial [Muribaculaceae bacterium]|nr:exo-alpha-sialidase [Muribaculaceae bacterium]
MKYLYIIVTFLLMFTFASAKDPYNYPRIFWDHNNFVSTGLYGGYALVIELQDGRLMMLIGNTVSYSSDKGKTWSAKQSVAPALDKISYASPDFIQLSDGTIVIGLNLRPQEPYSEDRLFGVRTVRSTDGGKTWEAPAFV